MEKRIVALVCALTILVASLGCAGAVQAQAASTGTTYYISNNGDNSNSGTSENQAWQTLNKLTEVTLGPGDQVLLERGSVFHGYIHLQDVHGTEEAPIKIGAYGKGNRPIINANGEGIWYQDYVQALDNSGHRSSGYVSSTILLYDVDYVEIEGLEITNQSDDLDYIQNGIENISARMDRTGVAGVAKDGGTMTHVYLNDLYIHDVDGNLQDKHMNNGGIQMNAFKPADEAATGIARYDDIRITNCHIKNVHRAGLVVGYTYQHAHFEGSAISDDTVQKYGHTRIYVAGNYLQDIGNDALCVMYAYRPLVERNISDKSGIDLDDQISGYWQSFCAAIWPWKTKDAIFQYNEAFDTVGLGNGDGQAWDIDYSDGTIYQYNYSHNNGGGSMLVCLGEAYQGTFRYNLSYNDLKSFITFQGNPLAKVYNNVFYVDGDLETRVHHPDSGKRSGTAQLYNNIFYNASTGNPNDEWEPSSNKTFSNNLYYGYDSTPSTDANAVVVTDGSSIFAGPLTAPITTSGTVVNHDNPEKTTPFDGFKLAANSPAINAGMYVSGCGTEDFFGNPLGDLIPDIGMHETSTPSDTAVTEVYSDSYTVTASAITGVELGTTVAEFKAKLTCDKSATLEVLDGTEPVHDNAFVKSGMTLKLTCQDVEKTYTISVEMTVSSLVYDIDGEDIQQVVERTTVAEFKGNMIYHEAVKATVYNGAVIASDEEYVTEGMVLYLELDGVTREFTLHIIKSYLEYAPDGMTATAGSEEPNNSSEGSASYALDNNSGTMWHTDWDGCTSSELWIMIDMGQVQDVAMLKYVPRSSGVNGRILTYEIYVGTDADNMGTTPVATGSWDNDADVKYAYFDTVSARYVKLVAKEVGSTSSLLFASAVEIRLGYEEFGSQALLAN